MYLQSPPFLPDRAPHLDGYELACFYRAARHIGGDYYDFIPLADGRMAFALGDVVGKGVPAALKMVRLASETRACLESLDSLAAVLRRLNQRLTGDFVTMIIGILDPRNHTITVSSAGHEHPMLHTCDGCITEIGKGRIQECVIRNADRRDARLFLQDLVEQVDLFASDHGQFDDMCLVQILRRE